MSLIRLKIGGSAQLIVLIKSAYWIGLMIISVMVMTAFLLLRTMLAQQQADIQLSQLNATQTAISQRIIVLSRAIDETPAAYKPQLVDEMRRTTAEFRQNYEKLVKQIGADTSKTAPEALRTVLYDEPFQLDLYSQFLIADAQRFVAVYDAKVPPAKGATQHAKLDITVANNTLAAYTELGARLESVSNERLEELLHFHQLLYYGTIAVIVIVALGIFRPMSNVILRKTVELTDARNSMEFIAVHDRLTGLHNRAFLTDHFDTLLKGSHRRRERLAVIQLDLDRFKQINDTLGHAAGDYVLVATAQRMLASCRASDVCVRLGGDEFVMLLSGAGNTEDINMVANRVLEKINEPITFQSVTIMPGASAGIAVYPVDAETSADLLVHADLALYNAKKQGGGTASFFSEELRKELDYRKTMEAELKVALSTEAFEAYFQPQVSLSTGAITGVEALMRWRHPERGMISPGEFIPVAEKAGLMAPIGRMVMRRAIAKAADWHRSEIPFGRLAINVSGTELRENDFDAFLFDTLEKTGLPARKLSLEIVESVILDDEQTGVAAKLRRIRSAGIALELDDFGTGYASLSHVNPNEIDRLKIDRRFVQNIDVNGDNSKIVRAITELARGLGISIIAEGAETEAELASLQSLGCDNVQGYSIAFPMPGPQTREWLMQRANMRPKLSVVTRNEQVDEIAEAQLRRRNPG
jgi:diguanylate cyclase